MLLLLVTCCAARYVPSATHDYRLPTHCSPLTTHPRTARGQVLRLSRQVAGGLYYLHCCTPPVLHLDLKSANVLLDEHGVAKVCI